jgi:preprotein translocase subunit YajC
MLLLAQAAQGYQPIIMIALVFGVMYFLVLRPQQKQLKEHRTLLGSLKKGDDVVTQSGIFGKIHVITDKVVTLEVANNVRIRVLKTSIQGKTQLEDDAAPAGVEKKEEK